MPADYVNISDHKCYLVS